LPMQTKSTLVRGWCMTQIEKISENDKQLFFSAVLLLMNP